MSKDENKAKKEKKSVAKKNNFVQDIIAEAKRVNWPNLKKTHKAVASVFFVILIFAVSIWVFDTTVQGFGRWVGFYREAPKHQARQHVAEQQIPSVSADKADEKSKQEEKTTTAETEQNSKTTSEEKK